MSASAAVAAAAKNLKTVDCAIRSSSKQQLVLNVGQECFM